jgi:hypothetical protein
MADIFPLRYLGIFCVSALSILRESLLKGTINELHINFRRDLKGFQSLNLKKEPPKEGRPQRTIREMWCKKS